MSATRPLVVKVWSFELTNDAKVNSTVSKPAASVAPCVTLAKEPTAIGKTQQTQEKKTNQSPVPADACKVSLHPPPYAPVDTVPPPPHYHRIYNLVKITRTSAQRALSQYVATCPAAIRTSSPVKQMGAWLHRRLKRFVTTPRNGALQTLTELSVPQ